MRRAASRSGADDDREARLALWNAIRQCSNELAHRFGLVTKCGHRVGGSIASTEPPAVPTWRLVEAISLLGTLIRAEEIVSSRAVSLFATCGPIEFREDGRVRYLWAQAELRGERTSLGGRPDLIVTSTGARPAPANAIRVVESKCRKDLGAPTIRAEFGKAHDLRVAAYFIWSFYTPRESVVAGARAVGLDVAALGFDTERRKDLIKDPIAVTSHVAHALEESRKAHRFVAYLEQATAEARGKLALR